MRISVALCTYNGSAFLAQQLESLADQSRPPDELVVCDDGSTDSTVEILERFASTVSFPVRITRNEHNLRTTKNFEKAIRLCEGDLIATADQDDRWLPSKLERIEAVFQARAGVGLVFTDADLIDERGDRIGASLWKSVRLGARSRLKIARGDGFNVLLRRPAVTGATMIFRSSYREAFLPIPPSWVHDEWIALVISALAGVVPITEFLMQYRRHPGNQCGVNGVTVAERTRSSMEVPKGYHASRCAQFLELEARLREIRPDRPELAARVAGKVRHYRALEALPDARIRRVPRLLRELLSLRYSRYSGTTLAIVRDLIAQR